MQEIMKDGSHGKTFVKDSIEDLVPHIKKSLEDPNVKFIKVFMARGPIENEEIFSAEEQKISPLDELLEKAERVKLFVEFKKSNIEIKTEDGEISIGIPYRFDIEFGRRNISDLLGKLGFDVEIKK